MGGCLRQYDEVQPHGQVYFAENVESITICKPWFPDEKWGRIIRHEGKLIIVNPVPDYVNNSGTSPSNRKAAGESLAKIECEYESDDYYLFFDDLALLDNFDGATPAFDAQVRRWSSEKVDQFRSFVLTQQSQMVSMAALVLIDLPGFGFRYCFHLRRCLDCIRERYPEIEIRRVVTNPGSFEFEFETSAVVDG